MNPSRRNFFGFLFAMPLALKAKLFPPDASKVLGIIQREEMLTHELEMRAVSQWVTGYYVYPPDALIHDGGLTALLCGPPLIWENLKRSPLPLSPSEPATPPLCPPAPDPDALENHQE